MAVAILPLSIFPLECQRELLRFYSSCFSGVDLFNYIKTVLIFSQLTYIE